MANTKKLTVVRLDKKAGGRVAKGEKRGSEWALYEVVATDENGEGIDAKLKTFEQLPTGKLIEVEVEVQNHPKYGKSFLLSHVDRPNGLKGQVDWLTERVGFLETLLEQKGIKVPEPLEEGSQLQPAAAGGNPDDVPL